MAQNQFEIFDKALFNTIAILPANQKDFKTLLQRIKDGFERQRSMNDGLVAKMNRLYNFIIDSQENKLRDLEQEYSVFKEKNSLEKYFTKYLSLETKKKILGQIDELKKETEWGYYDASDLE